MTMGAGPEPWLPDGFPPPSFVVEPERVVFSSADSPLQSRLLVGGALLGAVLLVLGLILMATSGGGDETALTTAPDTGATSTIPELSFPPVTGFEDSFLVPEETVPPTLPAPPQTPIFPITPPAPGTTARPAAPATTTRQTTPSQPSNPPVPTQPTTTSTTTPPPPAVSSLQVQRTTGDSQCGARVTATVNGTNVGSVVLTVIRESTEQPPLEMVETMPGTWFKEVSELQPDTVRLQATALDLERRPGSGISIAFSCPPA